jgi:pimeloyl-ACP methyl ester carboxylesterase
VPTALGDLAVHEHLSPDPQAPVALLWHSMFADSSSWDAVVPQLLPHRRLLVVDGPGYGASDPLPRRTSIGESAEVGEQVLDHLGVASVDWVGNAWGGHAGLHLAATRPGRIRTLVAISSPVNALTRSQLVQIRLLNTVVRLLGPVRPVRDAIAGVQLAQPDGPYRPVVDAALRRPTRRSLALTVQSFVVDRTDLSWALPRIAVPTLVVATDDRYDWTPELAEAAAARLPRGSFTTVPGADVVAPLEQPDLTAEAVLAFWAREGTTSG